MYFSPQATVLQGADPALWGLLATPLRWGNHVPAGYKWIADNGCFSGTWGETKWMQWLDSMTMNRLQCVMATAPDVVGDAAATLERYKHYAPLLRVAGWRVGLVAQDGLESLPWPLDYDALFIGGSTEWKLSDAADWCIGRAKQLGRWVHVGRCNSIKRIKHFKLLGVNSCDGTTICYEPDKSFRMLNNALKHEPLFTLDSSQPAMPSPR